MRYLLTAAALALSACSTGPGDVDGERVPCVSQSECDPNRRKVCEDGYCSALLPENTELDGDNKSLYMRNLSISAWNIRFQKRESLRAYVIYPVTPDGRTVRCSDIASYEELNDPSRYNLTVAPVETRIQNPGHAFQTLVFVNGPGRILYVEIYNAPLYDSPDRVGVGCLEAGEIPESGVIGMEITPKLG